MFPTPQTLGSEATLGQPAAPHATSDAPPRLPHLLVPCATSLDDACQPLLAGLQLPNLQRLLALADPPQQQVPTDKPTELTLSPPHERALARVLHLLPDGPPSRQTSDQASLDGQLPWAAWACRQQLASPDTPAAWFSPCHQEVGAGHVTLYAPDQLNLSDQHSQALMAALQPLAEEDGLRLSWVAADRWLAQGQALGGLPMASLDRVAGRSIAPWVSTGTAAAALRRLQSEAQMLFYTHPANDQREALGLAAINAFWVSGSGVCPPNARSQAPECAVVATLRAAALVGNWPAWAQAWQTLDAQVLPAWLQHAQRGHAAQITLCGDRTSVTLNLPHRTPWQAVQHKISSFLTPLRTYPLLLQL